MLTEPVSGFTRSFEEKYRHPIGKLWVNSHVYLSSDSQDGYVTVDGSNTYAQSFTPSANITTKFMHVFLSRNESSIFNGSVDVRILADSAGMPDTGTVIGQSTIPIINNLRPEWYEFQFSTAINLTGSTTYWIEIQASGIAINWYKNSGESGEDYVLNNTTKTEDQALIFRIKDTVNSNRYKIPNLLRYNLNLNDRVVTYTGTVEISNIDNRFDEGQPLKHLLSKGVEVTVSIGNELGDLDLHTFFIDSTRTGNNVNTVSLVSKHISLINQTAQRKDDYTGEDYGEVVADLLQQAGLIGGQIIYADSGLVADNGLFADQGLGDIDQTGLNFPSQGTLTGSVMDSIRKIEDVTGYVFYFKNDGTPAFKPENTSFSPVFTLDRTKHILRDGISNSETKQMMFNRLLADNKQTSDGNSLSISDSTLQATYSGTISSSTRSISITHTFTSSPVVRAEIVNKQTDNDTLIQEQNRDEDSINIEIFNKNYPSTSATYEIDIYGSTIGNDDASLVISEKINPTSTRENKIVDYRYTNDFFTSVNALNQYTDRLLLYNSLPRGVFNVNTIGVPVLESRDIISVTHDRIKSSFIFKIAGKSLSYSNAPRQYAELITIERYPFLNGESISSIYLYADDDHVSDDGLTADSELEAFNRLYN